MKYLSKFFIFITIISMVFSPLNGFVNKSKAADEPSAGSIAGKAVAAGLACWIASKAELAVGGYVNQVVGGVEGAAEGRISGAVSGSVPVTASGVESKVTAADRANTKGAQSDTAYSLTKTCIRDTAVKIIMDYVVDQIVGWIQGEGKPRFVSDWNSFLQDAANAGVGEVVRESGLAALCQPFKLQVKVSLFPVGRFKQKIECTLTGIVGNIDNFMADFQNGSWIGYGALWQPNNNYFGVVLQTYDESVKRAAAKKEAASNEALSSNGFLSSKQCVQRNQDEVVSCVNGCMGAGDVCGIAASMGSFSVANVQKYCEQQATCSKYEILTPGDTIGKMAAQVATNDLEYAKNVQSWTAAIVNAAVNRVIKTGLAYMTTSQAPSTDVDNPYLNPGGGGTSIASSSAKMLISGLADDLTNAKTVVTNDVSGIKTNKTQSLVNMQQVSGIYDTLKTSCPHITDPSNPLVLDTAAMATAAASSTTQITKDIAKITEYETALANKTTIPVANASYRFILEGPTGIAADGFFSKIGWDTPHGFNSGFIDDFHASPEPDFSSPTVISSFTQRHDDILTSFNPDITALGSLKNASADELNNPTNGTTAKLTAAKSIRDNIIPSTDPSIPCTLGTTTH